MRNVSPKKNGVRQIDTTSTNITLVLTPGSDTATSAQPNAVDCTSAGEVGHFSADSISPHVTAQISTLPSHFSINSPFTPNPSDFNKPGYNDFRNYLCLSSSYSLGSLTGSSESVKLVRTMAESELHYWEPSEKVREWAATFFTEHWANPEFVQQACDFRFKKEQAMKAAKPDTQTPVSPSCISFVEVTINDKPHCFVAISGQTREKMLEEDTSGFIEVRENIQKTLNTLNSQDLGVSFVLVPQASDDYQNLVMYYTDVLSKSKNAEHYRYPGIAEPDELPKFHDKTVGPKGCSELSFIAIILKLAMSNDVDMLIHSVINCRYYPYLPRNKVPFKYNSPDNTDHILRLGSEFFEGKNPSKELNQEKAFAVTNQTGERYSIAIIECCQNCQNLKPVVQKLMLKSMRYRPAQPFSPFGVELFFGSHNTTLSPVYDTDTNPYTVRRATTIGHIDPSSTGKKSVARTLFVSTGDNDNHDEMGKGTTSTRTKETEDATQRTASKPALSTNSAQPPSPSAMAMASCSTYARNATNDSNAEQQSTQYQQQLSDSQKSK